MRNEQTTLRLTERDDEVLDALGSYRFLTGAQLATLWFPSAAAAGARLRALLARELVVRVFMPVRPFDRTATTIWALSAKGARRVREVSEGARPDFLSAKDRRSALFLDHTLRRNDVRICLEVLDRRAPGLHLLRWAQAPEDVRGAAVVPVGRGARERVPIVPDGFFALRHAGRVQAFCVEIDMGTVSPVAMARRYRAYWAWWKRGGMAGRFGEVPLRVLTLTTTPARLERLRRLAVVAPTGGRAGSGLFWFSLLAAADINAPERLIAGPWAVARAGPAKPRLLLDEPSHPPYETKDPPDEPASAADAAATLAHAREPDLPEVPRVPHPPQGPARGDRGVAPVLLVPEADRGRVGVSAGKHPPGAVSPPFAPRRRRRARRPADSPRLPPSMRWAAPSAAP